MTYRDEFPDFDPTTMPTIPDNFADDSWHNDAMPSFVNEAKGLKIWIDYSDPAMREIHGDNKRFMLTSIDSETVLVSSDTWSDILAQAFNPKS